MSPVVIQRSPADLRAIESSQQGVPAGETYAMRLRLEEVESFTRNLLLQLEAGVPLLRALESQQSDEGYESSVDVLIDDLRNQIEAGRSFGDALERWPNGFPRVYRSLIHAGERSGQLDRILGELTAYLSWLRNVRKTIKKALVYPSFVAIATLGLVTFLMTWLMPRFAPLFERLGDSLPFATEVLLDTSNFLRTNWMPVAVLFLGFLFCLWVLSESNHGRRALSSIVAQMPLTRGVVQALEVTRLTRNLSILTAAGIPIVDAIELARESAATNALESALETIHDSLMQGNSVAGAFEASGYFPRDVRNLIVVGEEAGKLDEILGRLADHYDDLARERVDRFVQALEPITTVILGLIVGGIAVAILTTLYQVMQQAGKI